MKTNYTIKKTDKEMREDAYKWFSGNSERAKYMICAYYLLIEGNPVKTIDILASKNRKAEDEYIDEHPNWSSDSEYDELKNAISELKKLLEWKGCRLVTTKDSSDKRLAIYTLKKKEGVDDPLEEELTYVKKLGLKDYVEFCKNADGFIPDPLFFHFFHRHPLERDKIHRSTEGKQLVQTGANTILKNIEMLPDFFEWIQNKKVVKLTMEPFILPRCELVIHPQFIKEFNGRWYVYGYCIRDGKDIFDIFSLPLDRIAEKPKIVNVKYKDAAPGTYDEYFRDIIGVTHGFHDGNRENTISMGKKDVLIRIHTEYIYGLVTTKKFHHSQEITLPFGKHDNGNEYGEITLKVEPNNELLGKVRQMGSALEITEPKELREKMASDIERMFNRYKSTE
ncbi:MAG: WYL domain-containing protein [Prevotella sp.]|nr:WYL domain-containing protein [Candidatus Prevotella equi]